jgi:hypothetical protein
MRVLIVFFVSLRALCPSLSVLCVPSLLDKDGHVRLSDFGLAGDLNIDPDGHTVGACGTAGYMSQELLANLRYDTSPDVFAFGVVLYELLHGQVPHQVEEDPVEEVSFHRTLSEPCKNLILMLLQPDPARRLGCDKTLPLGERWGAVKAHPFFAGVDWALAARRGLDPPFVPQADTANCDPMYELEEQLREQPVEEIISPQEDAVFNGWDWHTEPHYHTRRSGLSLADALLVGDDDGPDSGLRAGGGGTGTAAAGSGGGGHLQDHHERPHSASGFRSDELELIPSAGDEQVQRRQQQHHPHHQLQQQQQPHGRHFRSGSFDEPHFAAVSVLPSASGVAAPAASSEVAIPPPRNIHQNPSIDSFTHYYVGSPGVLRPSPSPSGSDLSPVDAATAASSLSASPPLPATFSASSASSSLSSSLHQSNPTQQQQQQQQLRSPNRSPARRANSVQVPAHSSSGAAARARAAQPSTASSALARALNPLGKPVSHSTPPLLLSNNSYHNGSRGKPGHQITSSMQEEELGVITLHELRGSGGDGDGANADGRHDDGDVAAVAAADADQDQVELDWEDES